MIYKINCNYLFIYSKNEEIFKESPRVQQSQANSPTHPSIILTCCVLGSNSGKSVSMCLQHLHSSTLDKSPLPDDN